MGSIKSLGPCPSAHHPLKYRGRPPLEGAPSVVKPLVTVDHTALRDFSRAITLEWLETDGMGGYASSTVLGINTRRYHGLLIAAATPPVDRLLLLAKIEETVSLGATPFLLSANCYPDTIYPHGHTHLDLFRLAPWPIFTYRMGEAYLDKHCFMVHGEPTTVVAYHLRQAEEPADIHLRLMVGFRGHHELRGEETSMETTIRQEDDIVVVEPPSGLHPLYVAHTGTKVDTSAFWYHQLTYPWETERGLADEEDLYSPLALIGRIEPGGWLTVVASARRPGSVDREALMEAERERRSSLVRPGASQAVETLSHATSRFIVRRGAEGTNIIAGYPWFTDWGRDAMISLPGLALAAGRPTLARSLLETYAGLLADGLLPNYFPEDGGPPSYDSVDAALWFIVAAHRYMEATGDEVFLKDRLGEACRAILSAYEAGTASAIRMDVDGLLTAGGPGSHLTWMDGKVGDVVITPRHGKPVEVNALWYNALSIGAAFAERLGWSSDAERWAALAGRVRERFDEAFWYDDGGHCYDLVRGDERDVSIRPNQIFALSLPYPMLDEARRAGVLAVVTAHLLTPMGLRTLSPYNPRYKGRHGKTLWEQDAAYHQGTVWAYLMGPYIDAYLTVHGEGPNVRDHARRLLEPLLDHLQEACLGTVSELFDGDPPHAPQGCTAQAWSVAELLRVLTRLEG